MRLLNFEVIDFKYTTYKCIMLLNNKTLKSFDFAIVKILAKLFNAES